MVASPLTNIALGSSATCSSVNTVRLCHCAVDDIGPAFSDVQDGIQWWANVYMNSDVRDWIRLSFKESTVLGLELYYRCKNNQCSELDDTFGEESVVRVGVID